MRSITFLLSMAICFSFCTESAPDCIIDKIEDFKNQNNERPFTFIYQFDQKDQTYYIFDSGIAFDATAVVMDDKCQQVCTYGGFRPASPMPCENYQKGINEARQIWP